MLRNVSGSVCGQRFCNAFGNVFGNVWGISANPACPFFACAFLVAALRLP
jgi:hypothetical protein